MIELLARRECLRVVPDMGPADVVVKVEAILGLHGVGRDPIGAIRLPLDKLIPSRIILRRPARFKGPRAGRADIYFSFGDWDKAAADYATYLTAHPTAWLGHQRRGVCLHNLNDLRGAISAYERTIELNPRSLTAYNNLAWIRATSPDAGIRDGAKAVDHAKKAVELAGQEKPWLYMDTLAVACAEAGEFRQAVDLLTKALALMTKPEDRKDRPEMEARLKLFQQGKPFREKLGPDRRP